MGAPGGAPASAWAEAPGIRLTDSSGATCSPGSVPELTLADAPPPACSLRGTLLTASEASAGVRLTDVPAGSVERERRLVALNTERGRRIGSEQLTGWGRSLMFQGALLLLYDSTTGDATDALAISLKS